MARSHITVDVINAALKNHVELLSLPAHTSSILQPLDVGVFSSVKSYWMKTLKKFYKESHFKNVDKQMFPKLLKKVWINCATNQANAINGFEACGIYPLNQEIITPEKLSVSEPLVQESTLSYASSTPESSHTPHASATQSEAAKSLTP